MQLFCVEEKQGRRRAVNPVADMADPWGSPTNSWAISPFPPSTPAALRLHPSFPRQAQRIPSRRLESWGPRQPLSQCQAPPEAHISPSILHPVPAPRGPCPALELESPPSQYLSLLWPLNFIQRPDWIYSIFLWVLIPNPALMCCVMLDKLFNLSGSWFPPLQNGDSSNNLIRLLGGSNEILCGDAHHGPWLLADYPPTLAPPLVEMAVVEPSSLSPKAPTWPLQSSASQLSSCTFLPCHASQTLLPNEKFF